MLFRGQRRRHRDATDGQLRLEGIDAPELHYRGAEQPLARRSRDALLALVGFDEVLWKQGRTTVRDAVPPVVPAVILAASCDPHGRPIAYLFTSRDAEVVLARAPHADVDEATVRRSINAELLLTGAAFPLAYDTQPAAHRDAFRALAHHARRVRRGVWAHDETSDGLPVTATARTPRAPLVWPKLFRRVVDYVDAVDTGFRGSLLDWLDDPLGGASSNDALRLADGTPARLRELLHVRNHHVGIATSLVDVTIRAHRPHDQARSESQTATPAV